MYRLPDLMLLLTRMARSCVDEETALLQDTTLQHLCVPVGVSQPETRMYRLPDLMLLLTRIATSGKSE